MDLGNCSEDIVHIEREVVRIVPEAAAEEGTVGSGTVPAVLVDIGRELEADHRDTAGADTDIDRLEADPGEGLGEDLDGGWDYSWSRVVADKVADPVPAILREGSRVLLEAAVDIPDEIVPPGREEVHLAVGIGRSTAGLADSWF